MASSDRYFTIPLPILRAGKSALDALNTAVQVGGVSAGVGYKEAHDEEEFERLLDEARTEATKQKTLDTAPRMNLHRADGSKLPQSEASDLWNCALAGWKLLRMSGGNREISVQEWLKHRREGDVFFQMRSDFVWNALYAARRENGENVEQRSPMSFREFRILGAILSARRNKLDFAFLGWESIQARACGFHSKELFEASKATLPAHCQPLSRSQIRTTCDNLEALGFFARVRYTGGDRGGLTAYSVRHERSALIEAVKQWRQANESLRTKTAANRASDRAAFRKSK